MSIVSEKLKQEASERKKIYKNVNEQNVLLSDEEKQHTNEIIRKISSAFSESLSSLGTDVDSLRQSIKKMVKEECEKLNVAYETEMKIEKTVLLTVLGNGPIEPFLADPTVTEIVVQRYDKIVIERNGKIEKTDITFTDENHLQTIIKRIVQKCGRQISITNPIVDARLKDGSRVNATIPPVSVDGATLTIRKFSKNFLTGDDYIEKGSLNKSMLYFLYLCVIGKLSIIVSGATGTGKTTLLNMLSEYIPDDELIITIEDSVELQLQQENVRRMETRLAANSEMMNVNQSQLVKAALRQRPDRIIIGEARDGSIVDIISAMSTGHEGSMTTIHANSPENMCNVRIPILYSMNKEADFTENTVAMQIAEAVDIIVQIERIPDGSRKITRISYIEGTQDTVTGRRVIINDVFYFDKDTKNFIWTNNIPEKVINSVKFRGKKINMKYFE